MIALFTRDLRVHDNPMLAAAAEADHVVPLFVRDKTLQHTGFVSKARQGFLDDALVDLDSALRKAGAGLVARDGELVGQVCRIAEQVNAATVHLSADVSTFALRRQKQLAAALASQGRALQLHNEVHTVLAPGRITPSSAGADHFAVFTPYLRRWLAARRRPAAPAPRRLKLPPELDQEQLVVAQSKSQHWVGGEQQGRRQARKWFSDDLASYEDRHDDLAGDATSRLSPYLHFGCLSPRELAAQAAERSGAGAEAFVRQLAWRDFHHQVLAARPDAAHADYRPRGDRWLDDDQALQAWLTGNTGIPIVDAGMRQLLTENWMHNRARLIVGSFLTKTLYLDWRLGAQHFLNHLVDGDLANNNLNWQWVAGTGTDTRPNRVLNPLRQAERFDPTGDYVRRWVNELADLDNSKDVHQPWRLGNTALRKLGYPAPIVDLDKARDRFTHARQLTLDF